MALTGTETYGTVVPGFVTDGDGVLSTASVIDATERGFKVDADGRLVTTETADGTELGTVVPGFLTNADGALVVTTSATGAVFGEVVAGFWTSATGALIVEENPTTVSWQGGFLRNSSGYLGINPSYISLVESFGNLGIFLPLDETNGLTDLSGNGRNGTGAGGITVGGYTPGPGVIDDGATNFDGTDDYITTTYNPFVNGRVTTLMGWFNRDTASSADAIIGANAAGVVIRLNAVGAFLFSANGTNQISWAESSTAEWRHWAVVFDEPNDTCALYINGSLVSSQGYIYQWSGSYTAMYLGIENGTTGPFDGKMVWVSVTEGELTAAQIAAAAALGAA